MNEQERIAAFVTLHGLEISLEAGLEKIRALRKQFEALEPKAPGSSGLSTPTAPTEEPQIVYNTRGAVGVVGAVKGKRRARCSVCNALHWDRQSMVCAECLEQEQLADEVAET